MSFRSSQIFPMTAPAIGSTINMVTPLAVHFVAIFELYSVTESEARPHRYSAASLAPLFRGLPAFASTGARNLPV
jgi:hypothetical protein